MFFVHTNNVQTIQNVHMQMLIESYMLLLMYVLYILYTKPLHSLLFQCFCINNDAIFRSISHFCKFSGPVFSYSEQLTD